MAGGTRTPVRPVDDAIGTVPDGLFSQEGDTRGYFLLMEGLIWRCGMPLAVYSDRGLQAYRRGRPEAARANPVRPRHGEAGDTPDIRQITTGEGPGRADGGGIPGPAGDRAAPGGRHHHRRWLMRSCTASCRASTRSSGFRQSTQTLPTALWSHRCPWIRYSASSIAARWPGTTPSSTSGVPCSCCLVRSGLATRERRWRFMRAWTVSSSCSTGDARSPHRRRRRALEFSVPPMVLSDMAPALAVGSTGVKGVDGQDKCPAKWPA